MLMMVKGAGVSAHFGIERGFKPRNTAAEAGNHLSNDMIGANSEPRARYLQRQVPIADVPSDAQQVYGFGGFDFEDRLGSGPDSRAERGG